MQQQVLPPGMQNADHADLCSQVFGISRDLQQGLRAGSEQQVVEQTRVVQGQHIEFMGHSEHNMEVAGWWRGALAHGPPANAGALASGTWGSADFCTSCKRWPDVHSVGTHPGGHPVLRCGSAECHETL